jgi:hypothetical protein
MKSGLEIENLSQVRYDFKRFEERKQKELFDELNISAFEIETAAKRKLTSDGHVVTGTLRSSVHVVRHGDKIPIQFDENERYVGTDVEYAAKIEMLPDGGYLAHAANKQRPIFLANITKILNRK